MNDNTNRHTQPLQIIFDMDGVIFDTERFYLDCCIPAAQSLGMRDIEEICYRSIGLTETETDKHLMGKYGDRALLGRFRDETVRLFREQYKANGGLPEKPGARNLLTWLREHGARIALASSTRYDIVTMELRDAGLDQFFDVIIGGDMVGRSKPEPDIFLKAAELMEAEPRDCIVIEDSFNGIRAAHRAGMCPIMVPDLLQPDEEMRELAYRVFGSLDEVREWIAGEWDGREDQPLREE